MGYPMTWHRLIARNGLAEGDYGSAPSRWAVGVNIDSPGLLSEADFITTMHPHYVKRLQDFEHSARMLLGDIRRMESDAVDEGATCDAIAHRTNIDPDVVAAVLKEFIAL